MMAEIHLHIPHLLHLAWAPENAGPAAAAVLAEAKKKLQAQKKDGTIGAAAADDDDDEYDEYDEEDEPDED